ncbi:4-hydroxy-tetrahydrodipicolinate synthase [Saccharopolyspora phatthalungensis]|uniref:4-hydroxy-tetrahydrodipicolinate synthase n=1 Tax=Saccharopolyspora phatthalungensis TaxID=664693 RepID=A0A840Q0Y6_9PSEU|nr:4-hydroxy-tetrahydrodipicolinate synthase [Saccharopolyspora phatthalungensis]MBB5153657.1 4-hydroxy-tetrahydrodipicolinate synthase [Saccharopolyspora phatthalungensis]
MTTPLHGVLAALSTPFTDDGGLDEAGLREHVDRMIDAGIHGLVPCGSTGEFAALTLDERKRVTEITLDQAAGRVPVVPGTGSTSTAEAIELSRHAAEHGAAAVLAVQPFYEAPTRDEVMEYFTQIGTAAGVPVVVYNLPSVTGMNLDRGFYEELLERTDAVQYVKDTTGNLEQALDLMINMKGRVTTFVGWDTIVLPGLAAGGTGTIWGTPNFAPRECVQIYELAAAGQYDKADEIFRRLWNVMHFLDREGYSVCVKGAAAAAGIDLGRPRRPYSPLPPEKQEQLSRLVAEAGLAAA